MSLAYRPMYALTIWQPWADAIARGTKDVENRAWPASRHLIGEHIAIHAGLRFDRDAQPPPGLVLPAWSDPPGSVLPRGAVVAARPAGRMPLRSPVLAVVLAMGGRSVALAARRPPGTRRPGPGPRLPGTVAATARHRGGRHR